MKSVEGVLDQEERSLPSPALSWRKSLMWEGGCQERELKARRQKSPKHLMKMISK